jgi:three-Cys-motif partner protein
MKAPPTPAELPESYRGREQTYIKHLILRHYLERVARNILWSQREFVFVDGFSGPWASKSQTYEDTSFGIAMRRLRRVRDDLKETHNRQRSVRCIFVEKGTRAFARLSEAVKAASYIDAQAIHGRFEDHVDEISKAIGGAFALISIDPKGWSFDLQRLGPLLRHRPSEVLVNFMFEQINRFLDDPRPEIRASYVPPFGDADWRSRFDFLLTSGLDREDAVLELFREQLKSVGQFDYVLSARVRRPTAERSHFYLVYGTRNPKGLIEFRNVEKQAMEAEEHSRMEAWRDRRSSRSGQGLLGVEVGQPIERLREPETERATAWVRERLGKLGTASYGDMLAAVLERYSVTESELKYILVNLAKRGEIDLLGMRARQRKPDDSIRITVRQRSL